MKSLLFLLIIFNLITFAIFGFDKFLARTNRQRISEKTFLMLAIIGGSVGAVFAQKIFRHKTRKFKYLFWVILSIQFISFELLWAFSSGYKGIF
ncbi:MAG: DUF1294 domain-containing protein [Sulfuricurvum sp.]|uniref:DUF1294 domain-containing protein n=1 Tax=Sulfuricurvum sp. TaxID=2025608 RepID=UPI002634567D|nr:DUF1294 domain-containing protein [Sulfuricurvum sp.]MDD2829581.1 DUF1294 domain-containing protein [Sulfuricurvum sp.]MDD4950372.1 DUF1294 domain-containing protein [Sulfuricurvum sp.]